MFETVRSRPFAAIAAVEIGSFQADRLDDPAVVRPPDSLIGPLQRHAAVRSHNGHAGTGRSSVNGIQVDCSAYRVVEQVGGYLPNSSRLSAHRYHARILAGEGRLSVATVVRAELFAVADLGQARHRCFVGWPISSKPDIGGSGACRTARAAVGGPVEDPRHYDRPPSRLKP